MSNWLRDSILDLLALGLIIALIITDYPALTIILWTYTALLLLSKILALTVNFLATKASKTNVPDWFYHLIYTISTILLIVFKYYYLGGVWLIIWILSFVYQRNMKK